MASKCISEFTRFWAPSAWPKSLDHGLPVYLWVQLNPSLQMHLQPYSITASMYIFKKRWQVYGHTAVLNVEWATGSIYSGNPGVDWHHLIFIASYHTTKIHTPSFETLAVTCSFRDYVDPHRHVVSYLPTFFLLFSSYNRSFSRILFGCCERCGGMLIVASLPSSSVISLQRSSRSWSLEPLNGILQVLPRLCLNTIRGEIDRMYIYRHTQIMHPILWYSKFCDCNKDKYDSQNALGTLRTTAVRIQHQVSRKAAHRSQLLLMSPTNLPRSLSCSKIWLSYKLNLKASWMHFDNRRCFQEHLRMVLQSMGALCVAQGGSGSFWKYNKALVGSTGVAGRFACGYPTDFHFADVHLGNCVHTSVVSRHYAATIDHPHVMITNTQLCQVITSTVTSCFSLYSVVGTSADT